MKVTSEAMILCKSCMKEKELNEEDAVKIGYDIYSKKPSKGSGETWSKDEYSNLGLQYFYLRYKSIQRFTETYVLLQRAYNKG